MNRRVIGLNRQLEQLLRAALLSIFGIAGIQSAAADTIVPHTARYKVKISIASGTLTTVVRESGEGFYVHSVIEPTGLAALLTSGNIEESSQFSTGDSGVRPLIYSSSDTLSSDNTFMHFGFDWGAKKVTGTVNDEVYEYSLDQEVHDRVSIQYELMHNLMTGSPGKQYALLDDDELKKITITTIGEKRIRVPLGSFEAIGIQHQTERSKRITTLWCARELNYLPVLIEQSRKGKVRVRAELIEYVPGMPGETRAAPAVGAAN